jgi:hypothetical protein
MEREKVSTDFATLAITTPPPTCELDIQPCALKRFPPEMASEFEDALLSQRSLIIRKRRNTVKYLTSVEHPAGTSHLVWLLLMPSVCKVLTPGCIGRTPRLEQACNVVRELKFDEHHLFALYLIVGTKLSTGIWCHDSSTFKRNWDRCETGPCLWFMVLRTLPGYS